METLIQSVMKQLSGDTISSMGSNLGLDEQTTQQAIALALPIIVGALDRNASSSEGAKALTDALARDHSGELLTDVSRGAVRKATMEDGAAILGHVFGGQQQNVGQSIGKATGIDPQTVALLMSMLAPVVLEVLGQKRKEENWGASDVSRMLQEERTIAQSQQPRLSQLLDFDGDGDISDDVVSIGTTLLQGFLKK